MVERTRVASFRPARARASVVERLILVCVRLCIELAVAL